MGESKVTRKSDLDEAGGKNKRRVPPTASELGEKVKDFIQREKQTLRGNLKNIFNLGQFGQVDAPAPRVLIGRKAPNFKATAVFEKEFREIELSQFAGKYVLLFFYPLDFTFVCPTELHAFQERLSDFKKRGVEVLACSVDSQFSHLNWLSLPKEKGGIEGIRYGIISDLGGKIANEFGVLSDEGVAYRGLFLIDQQGVVRHQLVNDLPLGRSVDEALRVVDALQHVEKNGEVCPANWEKGKKAIQTSQESVGEYLSNPQVQ